jgi:MFS family permease
MELTDIQEATISPAFVYVTSIWYTRDEIPARTGVWFAGNSCGGFIASLLAYGIGQIKHPLHPWQWIFIIFGVITSLWSILVFFFLPDTISDAGFLTEEEKQYAEDRVVMGGTGIVDQLNSRWKPEQVVECVLDPKTYFFVAISVLTQIPNGGTGSFGNLALKSFGFTSLQSTLVTLPASVISMVTIISTGWLASRFQNITTFLIIGAVVPPVMGSALIFSETNRGVRLFAYYCVSISLLQKSMASAHSKMADMAEASNWPQCHSFDSWTIIGKLQRSHQEDDNNCNHFCYLLRWKYCRPTNIYIFRSEKVGSFH